MSSNSHKKMNLFVGFMEEFEDNKSPFKIIWPLDTMNLWTLICINGPKPAKSVHKNYRLQDFIWRTLRATLFLFAATFAPSKSQMHEYDIDILSRWGCRHQHHETVYISTYLHQGLKCTKSTYIYAISTLVSNIFDKIFVQI